MKAGVSGALLRVRKGDDQPFRKPTTRRDLVQIAISTHPPRLRCPLAPRRGPTFNHTPLKNFRGKILDPSRGRGKFASASALAGIPQNPQRILPCTLPSFPAPAACQGSSVPIGRALGSFYIAPESFSTAPERFFTAPKRLRSTRKCPETPLQRENRPFPPSQSHAKTK